MNPSLKFVSTLVASLALSSKLQAYPIAKAFHDTLEIPQQQPQEPSARRFDIPAGSLSEVLDKFHKATSITVTITDDAIAKITSAGVSGRMTDQQALRRILEGTGVSFRQVSPTVVSIELRMGDIIDVTGKTTSLASPKFTQPLRDTPQTVTVISAATLEAQGATSLRDAVRNTPGVTLMAGEGGGAPGDNFQIRGFSARNDVYLDGARDPGVANRDVFNTESVEISKGPSSVTAGRGSTGGAINQVTKTAEMTNFGSLRVGGGNADYKRATIDVNRRLGDGVAFRVNGMMQDSGVPRRDEVKQKGWGVAPTLGLGVGKRTSFTLGYERLHQNNVPDYGLPGTLPDLANSAGLTVKDLDFSNFYGLLSRDYEKMDSHVGTATLTHKFAPALTLRNLTRYGQHKLDRVVTPPRAASAANGGADPFYNSAIAQIRRTDTKYQYRTDKSLTNQTDLTSSFATGAVKHDAVIGIELSRDRQPSYTATDTFANGRPPVTSLLNPDPTQAYAPAILPTGATSDATGKTAAAYVFDTLKMGAKWQVNLSGRYDHSNVNYETVSATGVKASFGRKDDAVSGRAGVVFKPVTAGTLYAAYSTSFNPSYDGSFGLTLGATGTNSAALPPERSRNYEAGVKWDVAKSLILTAAAFRTEKTNAKTTDTSGATVLAGDQQVNGLELSAAGNITSRWNVVTGLSLMKSSIIESGVAAEVDKQLAYAPKSSFNIWSTYRLGPAFTVGGGAQFTDGYYFSNNNALTTANANAIRDLTRYWLYSLVGSYRVNKHVTIQLNGSNLSNARYVDRGYSGHFIPGPGRAFQITPVITF